MTLKSLGLFETPKGTFGGVYVPESLIPALEELEEAFLRLQHDEAFLSEYRGYLSTFAGRPTPLYHAKNLSALWGCQVYLKREDLLHGGAHKTNNALGQALMAKAMGKPRIIAETGAGQHGVATAMAGALLDLETVIYMGEVDMIRQMPNVQRMKLLGASVHPVTVGSRTLKDAVNEALRDWIANVRNTHYMLGTVAGPHPFPAMVKFFQRVMGDETMAQCQQILGRQPDAIVACVGGGSNAIGIFAPYLDIPIAERTTQLYGVEPAGKGVHTREHGAVLSNGVPGVLHGMRSMMLQDDDGQIEETYSISAGLDYPSVGPEHAYLCATGQVTYTSATDGEAVRAFHQLCANEGIIPALESSHAFAFGEKLAKELGPEGIMVINLSGRGDKDLQQVLKYEELYG
jgi:tryptophan synthase beta chain